jgi:SAM-dependent methyltransferase
MLELARGRARRLGVENVEFRRLELEWIDLPTASVDAALCRWGVMLSVDPAAALQEARRVLRPGSRIALAVWDAPEHNPWATIPTGVLLARGHTAPPPPDAPGMFALAATGRLQEVLEAAGFTEVVLDAVPVEHRHDTVEEYFETTLDLSRPFAEIWNGLAEEDAAFVRDEIFSLLRPYTAQDGSVSLPGRSLVAAASA